MSIERVGVIGAGQMGGGIAEVSARAGVDVLVYEPTEELTTAGKARITNDAMRLVMPPAVSIPLSALFLGLYVLVFGTPEAFPAFSGEVMAFPVAV